MAWPMRCGVGGHDAQAGGGRRTERRRQGRSLAVPRAIPQGEQRRRLLLAYGDLVESLRGAFRTAPDVNTDDHDMGRRSGSGTRHRLRPGPRGGDRGRRGRDRPVRIPVGMCRGTVAALHAMTCPVGTSWFQGAGSAWARAGPVAGRGRRVGRGRRHRWGSCRRRRGRDVCGARGRPARRPCSRRRATSWRPCALGWGS